MMEYVSTRLVINYFEQGEIILVVGYKSLKGGVHGSAHVHESKYFFAFARYDLSLFNLIRCS